MVGFRFGSGIFSGGRRGKQNTHRKQSPQLRIFNDGRDEAEGREPHEKLKPGWFYWKFGSLIGPFDDVEICDLLDKGELQKDSLVSLLNVPLATLLKEPAKRSDFHTMVHLKKPGLENPAMTRTDTKKHAMVASPAFLDVGSENVIAWLLSNPADTRHCAEDVVAGHAEPEPDDDKASAVALDMDRVDNGNLSLISKADSGNADVSTSTDNTMKPKSETLEMRCKADNAASELGNPKLPQNSDKDIRSRAASAPSKRATRSTVFQPCQPRGEAITSAGEALKMDAIESRKKRDKIGRSKTANEALKMDAIESRKKRDKIGRSKTANIGSRAATRDGGHSEPRTTRVKSKRRGPLNLEVTT